MSPRSPWRPQKLATRAQPLPPETSSAPFVLLSNLSFQGRREPAVLGSGAEVVPGGQPGCPGSECLLVAPLERKMGVSSPEGPETRLQLATLPLSIPSPFSALAKLFQRFGSFLSNIDGEDAPVSLQQSFLKQPSPLELLANRPPAPLFLVTPCTVVLVDPHPVLL